MSVFHPIRRLATGGMAEVFLAMQLGIEGFEKLVVLKQILPHLRQDEDFVQMFLEEARLAAALHHPNIVATLDVHRDEESFFIALEYISGEDLRYILGKLALRKERIPLPIACRMLGDVAAALDYAHTLTDANGRPRGIVHRDVGPSNIIVDYQGITRLVDFGIAKANEGSVYTQPGVVKGKFGYMAPEHVQHRPLDLRADVFSLGVVMHELLTGRRLFKEATLAAVVQALVSRPARSPSEFNPEISSELDRVVLAALEKDRDVRTQSAREVLNQLETVIQTLGPASHSDVATWMQTAFGDRLASRQAVEREVVLEGRRLQAHPVHEDTGQEVLAAPLSPLSGATTLSTSSSGLSNAAGSGQFTGPNAPAQRGDGFLNTNAGTGSQLSMGPVSYSQAQPTKSRTPLIAGLIVLILLLVGSVAYLLGRGNGPVKDQAIAKRAPAPAATPAATPAAKATLVVHVNPPGAMVTVAGKHFDGVGPSGTMVPIASGKLVDVAIEKTGFATSHQSIRLPTNATEHLHVNLRPQQGIVVAAVEKRGLAKSSPTQPPVPPAKIKKVKWHSRRKGHSKKTPKGKILVGYVPASAALSLDGTRVADSSPIDISGIATGKHKLTLSAPGYKSLKRAVTVTKGKVLHLNLTLGRVGPALGTLDITSTPSGSTVSIDGRSRGTTPLRSLRLTVASSHRIQVTHAGYQPWVSRFAPAEGKNPPLVANLKPLVTAAAPKAASPAAPPKAASPAAPAPRRATALLVPMGTKGSSSRGASLFSSRCGSCHGKSAKRVSPKRYTQKQWSRYFAYGRHFVRAPLSKVLSRSKLADVKAFLMSRAADVESATAAGVR